jgi:hypothetical protein
LDPVFSTHCYSPDTTAILSLDLAKCQTGYAILRVKGDWVEFIQFGRLKSDIRNDKNMFLIGQSIADFIRATVHSLRGDGYNVHVVIEHPWFGGTRSAQQYYLFEAALGACHDVEVNVSCPTAPRLKSFIMSQVDNAQAFLEGHNQRLIALGKKPLEKNKKHGYPVLKAAIKELYALETFANNSETCPNPEIIANDDEYDAIYLALFGAYFCMALPDLKLFYPVSMFEKSLYRSPQAFYSDRVTPVYRNLVWRQKGLDAMWKLLKANKWNSHGAKEQYLFNQLYLAGVLHSELSADEARRVEKSWKCKATKKDSLGTISTNYAGSYFMLTPTNVTTSMKGSKT